MKNRSVITILLFVLFAVAYSGPAACIRRANALETGNVDVENADTSTETSDVHRTMYETAKNYFSLGKPSENPVLETPLSYDEMKLLELTPAQTTAEIQKEYESYLAKMPFQSYKGNKNKKIKNQDYFVALWATATNDMVKRAIVASMKKTLFFEDYKIGNLFLN
jgi:hypothetical protein